MTPTPDVQIISVLFEPTLWPEDGRAASPHDTIDWPLGAWLRLLESFSGLTPEMQAAGMEWAPPYSWFEPDVKGEAPWLCTPGAYPAKGIIFNNRQIPAVGMSVFVQLGDWWMQAGGIWVARDWVGLRPSRRRPRPFLGMEDEPRVATAAPAAFGGH